MRYIFLLLLISLSFITSGCVDDPEIDGGIHNAKRPTVETGEILRTTANSVIVTGEVMRENGSHVSEAGFCWGSSEEFVVTKDNIKAVSKRKQKYEATIDGLINNRKYFIRAYAINAVDTAFGEAVAFNTNDGLGSVKTIKPAAVKSTQALCGGVIVTEGEAEVLERGVYLMKGPKASITDSLLIIDMKTDSFYHTLTGLKPETKYYVKAYAKNRYGEFNGAKVDSFTTTNGLPVIDNKNFKLVTSDFTYAEFSISVTSEGDSAVTAIGLCYSMDKKPTIENSDTIICGSGVGDFTGRLKDLQQQKEYYVRAFAINSIGTTYSDGDGIHTILKSKLPTVCSNGVSNINKGKANVTGEVLADGATKVTEAGFCWSTDPEPTVTSNMGMVSVESGMKPMQTTINGLKGGKTYYCRAFAKNSNGVAYGEIIKFNTPEIFREEAAFTGAFRIPGSISYCSLANNTGFLLGGDTGSDCTDEFWGYLHNKGEWISLKSQPEKLSGQSCFSTGFGLWAFGGADNNGKLSDNFYAYSTFDNTWSINESKNKPKGIYRAASCVLSEQAYLIGGRRDTLMNDVWIYNIRNAEWKQGYRFPIKQYGGISVVVNDRIYAGFGIINRSSLSPQYTNRLWSADESMTGWSEETSLPNGAILCAVGFNNSIYGIDEDGYIWEYETEAMVWHKKSRLPEMKRRVHCIYLLRDRIYIGLGDTSDSLISYDPYWDN